VSTKELEKKVLKAVRHSEKPPTPKEVVKRVTGKDETVRDTIISLVDRGKIKVTLDWKLRVDDQE
jgi:hypothetical protein